MFFSLTVQAFHPLRRFPGPKWWIAFPVLRHISAIRGLVDLEISRFHLKYGPVVCFGRDEVSFTDAEAGKNIYGHSNTHGQLPKVKNSASNPLDIVSSSDVDHSRYRRSLSHAFSAKGLQAQEPYVNNYVDQLLARFKDVTRFQTPTDMSKCEDDLPVYQALSLCQDARRISYSLEIYLSHDTATAPGSPKTAERLYRAAVMERLANSSAYNRGDFMDSMTPNRGQKEGLTDDELVANANILIVAGSETTATLLAGVTYFLLQNPEKLEKVVSEVRSVMQSKLPISVTSNWGKGPYTYMWACIQETSRLYPPVPTGLQRVTLDSTLIAGHGIPAGTKVHVHPLGASWSPVNFHAPERFLPERWLPEARTDPDSPFFSDKRDFVHPFSVGQRNFIGRNLAYIEMRLILSRLLWNFDLRLCEESAAWYDQRAYTAWEKPSLMCSLTLREN
ncbi:hypothetical protein N7490_011262 [Penicillium lividum]|nr:hypothetical protein N7490_011262 [Penicillium lividum]